MDTLDVLVAGFAFVGSALGFLSGVAFWSYLFEGVRYG